MAEASALPTATGSSPERPHLPFPLLFYFVIPGAIGFMLGWTGAGAANGWPKPVAVVIWALLSILGWLAADLGTRAVAPMTRAAGAPLALTLALGITASGVVGVPINFAVGELSSALGYPAPGFETLAHYDLRRALDGLIAPLLLWTGINLGLFQFGRVARYGYTPAQVEPPPAAAAPRPRRPEPKFLERVRPGIRGQVIALRAELHYVRVYTDRGDDLIHYRFGDALAEAEMLDGAAVHRSWWAAREAVEAYVPGERPFLVLRGSLRVPVSRARRTQARDLVKATRRA